MDRGFSHRHAVGAGILDDGECNGSGTHRLALRRRGRGAWGDGHGTMVTRPAGAGHRGTLLHVADRTIERYGENRYRRRIAVTSQRLLEAIRLRRHVVNDDDRRWFAIGR